MNLGTKIRRMRQVRGLTAVALAKYARVTPGFISQLEYSQTVPSLQTLERVAAALDVSLLWLLSPLPPQHLEVALLELPRAVSWSTVRAHEGQQCHLVLHGTVR